VALIATGAFVAAKGTAKLSELLPSGNKIVELAAPAVVTLVGVGTDKNVVNNKDLNIRLLFHTVSIENMS
jgi:pectate lyase